METRLSPVLATLQGLVNGWTVGWQGGWWFARLRGLCMSFLIAMGFCAARGWR